MGSITGSKWPETKNSPVSMSTVKRRLRDADLLGRVPLSSVCVLFPILILIFLLSQSRLFAVDVETGVLLVLFNEAASWGQECNWRSRVEAWLGFDVVLFYLYLVPMWLTQRIQGFADDITSVVWKPVSAFIWGQTLQSGQRIHRKELIWLK